MNGRTTRVMHNQIKAKVDKLMTSKLAEDDEFCEIIEYLQSLIGDVEEVNERQLRIALQDRELQLNREFLKNFEKINEEVQSFVEKIRNMNTICSELTVRIQTNKEKTRDLLAKTAVLQNEKKQLISQQDYINNFFNKYSLTEEEENALNSEVLNDNYFKILSKLCTIEQNIQLAISLDSNNIALTEMQKLIEEKTEIAYKNLFHATQRECRLLNVEFLELKPVLHQSLSALQNRQPLFDQILLEYTSARRSYIVRFFIDVLSKGRDSKRPIEQISNDPLRYVNEILAIIHQVLEFEIEMLQNLLKSCAPEIITSTARQILCSIAEALCQPLKLRIEQTLTRESNCVILYRLCSLLLYYVRQFEASMGPEAIIVKTLVTIQELCTSIFFSTLSMTVEKILANMNVPDYNLLPVHTINQALLLLRDILESQNDLAFSVVLDKKEMYMKIFAYTLDPLNQSLQLVCSNLHNPLDVAVYMLNCLNAIRTVIIMYQYTDTKLEMIKAQIEANEDVLVSEQASLVLTKTNMLDIYSRCVAHQPNQGPLSKISGMEQSVLEKAILSFNEFLQKPEGFQCNQIIKISSARNRETIQKRTFENVVNAYQIIYNKLQSPNNLYSSLVMKPVDEVSNLLFSANVQ